MTSSTYFLEVTGPSAETPNHVSAQTSGVSFLNYSLPTVGSLSTAESKVLVDGGVAIAVAEASSTFLNDPNFTALFTSSEGIGIDGAYTGTSSSQAKVVATFDVSGGQTLSFDFSTGFGLVAKEIEDPQSEYNRADAKAGFLILDTSGDRPKVLGYYGISGELISSEQKSVFKEGRRKGARKNITIKDFAVEENINGDDGLDLLSAGVSGTYSQSFNRDVSEVTIVKVIESNTKFSGDTLIGRLGEGTTYGSLENDKLKGGKGDNYFYGSLGNDKIRGKKGDDILEGGPGNDDLRGGKGNDRLYGGDDDDILSGGRGNNWLAGGRGADRFIIDKLRAGRIDTILDFEVGIDSVEIRGLGQRAGQNFFKDLIDTASGAQYTAQAGGQLLFSGVSVAQLAATDNIFA